MPATIRVASAATAILFALGSPAAAAAMEEKSTKPRIAVLEFKNKAEAQLNIESVRWGEWIADVERPRAAGSWAKADGLGVSWDVAESPGSTGRANDRLRSAGPRDGRSTAGRGIDIARVDGEIVAPGSTAGKQPKSRPMVLAPGDTRPRPGASTGGTAIGQAIASRAGDGREDAASGQATGKRQHMPVLSGVEGPIRSRTYYKAPLHRGSVMLRLAQPWAGCAVGDRFNGVYLTTGITHKYRLDGAEIVACGGSTVTINYTKFAAAGEPVR